MVLIPNKIAPGTTNTTMLLKTDLKYGPITGIKPKLTIPANIKAIDAIRNGIVSFAVKLNNPTKNPNITNVVTKICGPKTSLNKPATIAINNPTKKA